MINSTVTVDAEVSTFDVEDFRTQLAYSLSVERDRIVILSYSAASVSVSYYVRLDRDDANKEEIKKKMQNETYLSDTTEYTVEGNITVNVVENTPLPVSSPPPPRSSSSDHATLVLVWTVVGIILALLVVSVFVYIKQRSNVGDSPLSIAKRMTQTTKLPSFSRSKVRAPVARVGPSSAGRGKEPAAKAGPSSSSSSTRRGTSMSAKESRERRLRV